MNTADNFKTMTDLITQTHHRVSLLNECLLNELEILKANNVQELINISQKKESLMQELHEFDRERKKLTLANNINSKEEYLVWLDTLDTSSDLKNQWLALSEQVVICQNMNTTNGIISENMAIASQQALNIISGNTTPTDSTYTSSGKKPAQSNSLHNTTA